MQILQKPGKAYRGKTPVKFPRFFLCKSYRGTAFVIFTDVLYMLNLAEV